ncbi:hypothetical protein [Thioalkalivibrio sp. ALE16]|uniref:hypothetical protein n=1 Tax=Thioalkalivibrio sp. ALE16 TaxID=1158172 RepID=UPI000370D566|nr:hypothetical protein [Thioalkalivibrio sp. ALE16]
MTFDRSRLPFSITLALLLGAGMVAGQSKSALDLGVGLDASTPSSVVTLDPDLLDALRQVEMAWSFAPESSRLPDLVSRGALRAIPEPLETIGADWRLGPIAIEARGVDGDLCSAYSADGVFDTDPGGAGLLCIRHEDRHDLRFRSRPVPAEDRGYWVWRAEWQNTDQAERLMVSGASTLEGTCPGQIPEAPDVVLVPGQTYCFPAFRGEPRTHELWGAYYLTDPEASARFYAGGRGYSVLIPSISPF